VRLEGVEDTIGVETELVCCNMLHSTRQKRVFLVKQSFTLPQVHTPEVGNAEQCRCRATRMAERERKKGTRLKGGNVKEEAKLGSVREELVKPIESQKCAAGSRETETHKLWMRRYEGSYSKRESALVRPFATGRLTSAPRKGEW
jgi:hypothetical protein